MSHANLTLSLLPHTFAICKLDPEADIPSWALAGDFYSITRTNEELSLVCRQEDVPEALQCERGYRCLKVEGPLHFSLTGVLASLTMPLAQAGISILAVSTFDTDYLLVKAGMVEMAIRELKKEGHRFS